MNTEAPVNYRIAYMAVLLNARPHVVNLEELLCKLVWLLTVDTERYIGTHDNVSPHASAQHGPVAFLLCLSD